MTRIWGIHNDALGAELYERGFISVGWDEIGDLAAFDGSRDRIKTALSSHHPDRSPNSIVAQAGVLWRFGYDMREEDLVISPYKAERTLNFGVVSGPYRYDPSAETHRHRRSVRWLKTGVPRALFSQPALNEMGSALTLFRVRHHAAEFHAFIESPDDDSYLSTAAPETDPDESEEVEESLKIYPTPDSLLDHTRDVIARSLLSKLTHEDFELFTADLLRAMGYQARRTRYVADGGIDVIAHRDALGLEPLIIKVQCKHTQARMGRPTVQALIGTLAPNEVGLFVTLGDYTDQALAVERERQNLRLFTGNDITDLFLRHYKTLPARWRDLIPLRQVMVVDSPRH